MKKFVLFVFALLPGYLFADIDLEVNKGVNGAWPVGVESFVWQGQSSEAPVNIAQVVTDDLTNVGQFDVVNAKNMTQQNLNFWQGQKVNAVLTGEIDAQGADQYQVKYTLTNVYKNPDLQNQNNTAVFGVDSGTVLAEGQFLVNKAQLRQTAHRISNQIYQKLTGEPGVFMTHLAFVSVRTLDDGRVQYQLMTSDYDGQNAKVIYNSKEPIVTPAWSPGGKSLAFVAYRRGRPAIYLYTLQNAALNLLTSFQHPSFSPRFSLDGSSLFLSQGKGDAVNLAEINLKSGRLNTLTQSSAVITNPVPASSGQMYVTSTEAGSSQVYQFNRQNQSLNRVSFSGDANMAPDFANGVLVYLQKLGDQYQIMKLDQDSVIGVSPKGDVHSPSLSPKGLMMVYSMTVNGERRLILSTLNSAHQVLLPELGGDLRYPAWSRS